MNNDLCRCPHCGHTFAGPVYNHHPPMECYAIRVVDALACDPMAVGGLLADMLARIDSIKSMQAVRDELHRHAPDVVPWDCDLPAPTPAPAGLT